LQYWYKAANQRLRSENPGDQFSQQELSNIFYVHGQLGIKPPDVFLQYWYKAANQRLRSENPGDHFDQQSLSNIFYAHVLLGLEINEEFGYKIASKLSSLKERLSLDETHSVYLSCVACSQARYRFADNLIEELSHEFRSMKETEKLKKFLGSELENAVAGFISSFLETTKGSVASSKSYWIDTIASKVDMVLINPRKKGVKIIVEVDGPSHFLSPTSTEYNPQTQLRQRLLSVAIGKRGQKKYHLLNIPYDELNKNHNYDAKLAYICTKLSRAMHTAWPDDLQ